MKKYSALLSILVTILLTSQTYAEEYTLFHLIKKLKLNINFEDSVQFQVHFSKNELLKYQEFHLNYRRHNTR